MLIPDPDNWEKTIETSDLSKDELKELAKKMGAELRGNPSEETIRKAIEKAAGERTPIEGETLEGEKKDKNGANDNDSRLSELERLLEETKKQNAALAAQNELLKQPAVTSAVPAVIAREDDISITVYHMRECSTGMYNEVRHGQGFMLSQKFFNYMQPYTTTLRLFREDFANTPTARAMFGKQILVVGEDTPDAVVRDYNLTKVSELQLSKDEYRSLLEKSEDELWAVYLRVNKPQQKMILQIIADAVLRGDKRITYAKLKKIEESQGDGSLDELIKMVVR